MNNLVLAYQNAMITGRTATGVRGAFVNFERSFNKTIPPLVSSLQSAATPANGARPAESQFRDHRAGQRPRQSIVLVLGASAQTTIRNLITGSISTSSVNYASGAPIAGSLMATLMSVPSSSYTLSNWDFVNDLASVYSSSSRVFT